MKSYFTTFILTVLSVASIFSNSIAQAQIPWTSHSRNLLESAGPPIDYKNIPKKLGHYTAKDWAAVIDSTWGEGLPTDTKLQLFDKAWNTFNAEYAAFQNLEVDWNALRDLYRPEIESGVSRGRFAAIMNHLGLALQETHTWIDDKLVNQQTPLEPGVPLFVVGAWMNNTHFGASLTPLPDSSLLVFKVLPNHPLDLIPGDIVLGYDGIPWKILYKEILKAQLPIYKPYMWGSTEDAMTHAMLMSAGMNWHLFDTLDVFKYGNGDTLHFSTAALAGQTGFILGNEQLDIPGVPWPDIGGEDYFSWMDVFNLEDFISWGIVDGTQIGYIYVIGWVGNHHIPGSDLAIKFYTAIDTLMNYYNTTGLIIDGRINIGGSYEYSDAFSLLFNSYIETFALDKRCGDLNNHFQMCPSTFWRETAIHNVIDGNPGSIYDKPIAILTGPGAVSQGDYFPLRMKFHPMVRIFGKSTAGAFSGFPLPEDLNGNADWQIAITNRNLYMVDNSGVYLCHTELEVDEDVWLTREDVVKGEDTVVKRAIEWIKNMAYAHDVTVDKTYATSGTDEVVINTIVENPKEHTLSIKTYIKTDTSTVDSLILFDDGEHDDIDASDGIWGAAWPTINNEENYRIDLKTKDLTANDNRVLPQIKQFTTIGPIKYDGFSPYILEDSVANPGDILSFKIHLKNEGHTSRAEEIEARLYSNNPKITVQNFYSTYGDITAGNTVESRHAYSLIISSDFSQDTTIFLSITISSEGYQYWSDSIAVPVIVTGIFHEGEQIPKTYALKQNYPNPFNPKTIINYELPITNDVELTIYNLLGQKAVTLVSEKQKAGYHQVEWNASGFASGVYYYRIEAGEFQDVKKMILLR